MNLRKVNGLTLLLIGGAFSFYMPQEATWKVQKKVQVKFSNNDVLGEFKDFKGAVVFDALDLSKSSFNFEIDAASAATENAMQTNHLKNSDWLHVEKYPVIRFVSNSFTPLGKSFEVKGILSLHGVEKEITAPFEFSEDGKKATIKSSFSFNRVAFGVGSATDGVDQTMHVDVSLPLKK